MTDNLGTHGATKQSWSRDSIRQVFRRIQEANPKAWHDRLVKLMCDEALKGVVGGMNALDNPDVLEAAMDYIVSNCEAAQQGYDRSEKAPQRRSPSSPEAVVARKAADASAIESIKQQIMLLNLPMANGKLARNCTGEELIAIGGNWIKVGRKIGKHKVLGQVLNEKQVQRLFGTVA